MKLYYVKYLINPIFIIPFSYDNNYYGLHFKSLNSCMNDYYQTSLTYVNVHWYNVTNREDLVRVNEKHTNIQDKNSFHKAKELTLRIQNFGAQGFPPPPHGHVTGTCSYDVMSLLDIIRTFLYVMFVTECQSLIVEALGYLCYCGSIHPTCCDRFS